MARERILVIDDSPTILKLVELALSKANYEVITALALESGLAELRAQRPDVVLLDADLPDFELEEIGKRWGELDAPEVPVILMSGRPEVGKGGTPRPTTVVDEIAKPFTPETLVAVLAHHLEKRRDPAAPRDVTDLGSLSLVPEETAISQTWPEVVPVAEAVLAGDMAAIPIADIYTLLELEAQTGTLTIASGPTRLRVFLSAGRILFANADGVADEFLLGRFLVKCGAIDKETLAQAVAARDREAHERAEKPALLGSYLTARDLVASDAVERALTLQTAALVFESLRFSRGRFWFAAGPLPQETTGGRTGAGLAVGPLLMEGFRRVDEWRLIEREVGDFDLIFVRDDERLAGFGRARLLREEMLVSDLCDGRRSVREILEASPLGAFDTTKMLYRLLRTRLIRRRLPAVAT